MTIMEPDKEINKKPMWISSFHKYRNEMNARLDTQESMTRFTLIIAAVAFILCMIMVIVVFHK